MSSHFLHDDRGTQPQALEMVLLGQPEVFYGTRRLVFRTQKALALLIYLAVTGTPQPRSHLAAFLWPDREEAQARATLRSTLRLVREAMHGNVATAVHLRHREGDESLVRSGRDGLGRESLWLQSAAPGEVVNLDLQIVERAATLASQLRDTRLLDSPERLNSLQQQLEEAAERCKGTFLVDFTLKDAPDFADWIEQQRAYWQGRVDRVLDALSSLQRRQGAFAAAIQTAEQWIQVNPLNEEAYRCLIESHAAAGDRTAALVAYANYAEMLARVLGIEPAPETVALAERLRTATSLVTPLSTARQERLRQRFSHLSTQQEHETPLVGREVEFGTLITAYERARQESVQVVIVEGEAGIGKTRLVEDFLRWVDYTRGALVLSGRVYETGGRLPYQPLVEALRAKLESERAPEDLLEDVWLMELSRILPELRERYPDLPVPTSEDSEARGRLFEAVAQLGKALLYHHRPATSNAQHVQQTPLVLFLDDLQWADAGTRDLLWFLCRRWSEDLCPVLVMLAVRLEEVNTSDQLRDWLHSLDRAAQVTPVILGMLDSTMTQELVSRLFGDTQHLRQMAQWFYTATGGQPLYFVQTLRALQEQQLVVRKNGEAPEARLTAPAFEQELTGFHNVLPSSMRAVIQRRLDRLTPTTRKLLMAGSILGTRFQPVHAWEIADLDESTGLDALEEAERHLVVRVLAGGEVCVFTHDRLREVAYTETGEARRRILHRRAFELLERNKASAAELANHAQKAGLVEPTFHYSLAAGDAAFGILAVHTAITHYEQAWSLLEDFPGIDNQSGRSRQYDTHLHTLARPFNPPADERERLLTQLGRAYEWVGALEQARNTYTTLRAFARERGAPVLEAAALNLLAAVVWQHSWDFAAAHALLDEALQIVEQTGNAAAIAETEWNLGQLAHWAEDFTQAQIHAHRALEIASAVNLDELIARSLFLIARSHNIAGEWDEAVGPSIRSRAIYAAIVNENERGRTSVKASYTAAEKTWSLGTQFLWTGTPPAGLLDYRARESYSLDLLAISKINLGEPQAGIEAAQEGLHLARTINNATAQVLNANKLQVGFAEVGEYEKTLQVAREAVDLIQMVHDPALRWLQLFTLADAQNILLQLEEARVTLDEVMALSETIPIGHWKSAIISRICMNCVLARDWPVALTAALRSIAIRDALPAKLVWLDFYRYYETMALLHGGNAAIACEDVRHFGEQVGNNRRFQLVHLRMQAVLASFEGKDEEAIAFLEQTLQIASQLGLPGEAWQIQAQIAAQYQGLGQEMQAEDMRISARDNINALATTILDTQLRMSFLNTAQSIFFHPEDNLWRHH